MHGKFFSPSSFVWRKIRCLFISILFYSSLRCSYCVSSSSHHSLTLVLVGGEWLASCPSDFTPGEGAPSAHWVGGWVSPRASLEAMTKSKILCPYWEWNPGHPACSLVSILTELSQLLLYSRAHNSAFLKTVTSVKLM
jgi:hypothetical protein